MRITGSIAAIAAAGCLLAAGVTAGTLGYLTSQEKVVNTFTVGDLKLGLKEQEWSAKEGDGVNVVPGTTVYKNPTIKNITDAKAQKAPCYARMVLRLADREGNTLTDADALALIKSTIRYDATYTGSYEKTGAASVLKEGQVPGYSLEQIEKLPMVNPLFSEDAKRSSGGMLVYAYEGKKGDGILNIGEEAALFTTLAIPTDWTQEEFEKIGDFRIEVTAEAIQSAGFASREAAFAQLDAAKDTAQQTETAGEAGA